MDDVRKVEDAIPIDSAAPDARRPRGSYRPVTLVSTIALACAAVAVGAGYQWSQTKRALDDANITVADANAKIAGADAVIAALVESASVAVLPNAQGESVETTLALARKALQSYASSTGDPHIVMQRVRAYLALAEIDFDRGWIDRLQEDVRMASASLDRLASSDDLEPRHLRAQAERMIGLYEMERDDPEVARLHFERGIAELDDLLKRSVDINVAWRWMRTQSDLHQVLGEVLLFHFNQYDGALAAFNRSRELRERLVSLGHQSPALEHDLALIAIRRADVAERQGNIDEALKLSTEARDRMDALKDRIWDNLRWAADYGVINADVGRLKRQQKRYAEAAPIFARSEEILVAVSNRDPKNLTRIATLNWVLFLRAENTFRLGQQNNDRARLLSAREQMQAIIAITAAIARESPQRAQIRASKIREEAFLAAIDATLRQLNGNHDSAAAGFLEASDIIEKGYLSDPKATPRGDLLTENIEYLEWAGAALIKAQKPSEAQVQFKRALDMLTKYRASVGESVYEDFHQRIDARYDRAPPATGTVQAPAENNATGEKAPPAAASPSTEAPSQTERAPSAGPAASPPQQ